MNAKLIITFSILFIAARSLFSQIDFRNGFIVTLENDTINGQVAYRSNSKNYASCIFKQYNDKKEYYPNQLLGFGYNQNKHFSSQITEEAFVEVLVIGDLSLFKSKSKYYLKKEGELLELTTSTKLVEENGEFGYKGNKLWKRRVYSLIKDCDEEIYDLMSKLKFTEKSITKLIVKYNKCKGRNFTTFKSKIAWTKLDIGVALGINKSTIQTIDDEFEKFDYLEEFYHSTDPSIGLVFALSSPRITDKISLQIETHFVSANYASLVVIDRQTVIDYNETYIEVNALSLPISLKYKIPKKKFDFNLQVGVNFDFLFNSQAILLSERLDGNVVNTNIERPAFEIDNSQVGYWGGVGMLKQFKKFNASISARYFPKHPFDKTSAFIANSNRISLNLILLKK